MPKSSNIKRIIESKNQRTFTSRKDAYDYLKSDVFNKAEFVQHVSDSAKENHVSYLLAYDLITNYLTDYLYEIDKTIIHKRKKRRFMFKGFFSCATGFMLSFKSRRLFLKQFLKHKLL
jgi:hypothetical protein